MDDEIKADVKKWTADLEKLEARAFKKLSQDEGKWWARFESLKAEGDAIHEADSPSIPPYILIAIRDNDERTLRAFFTRRGADPRLTNKVRAIIKGARR